ncbi:hypothetical protein GAYE_SCF07G2821 [Galdieria yellowstonensis]|uniref:Reverse transcriptase domain-containing protein n=1 Tax=Galdieria yellowstonensis TaxID=3028027 RepID=A0AAV9IC62_9RHOD|nr:hypothetical protein GAYE_SCF07G2821 [Galdieria yellowstonensis]
MFSVVEKLNSQKNLQNKTSKLEIFLTTISSAAYASACRVANSTIDDAVTFFASCASFGSLYMVKLLNKKGSIIHLWTFQSGKIPSSLNTSHRIYVSKRGNLSLMNNYPDSKRSKAHSILVRERVCIRTREECAAQVTALVECVQRRWNKEMRPTYACFIDLRKAFDRVPHEALFRKLESLRIRGRCLEFYRGLYHSDPSSSVVVRSVYQSSMAVRLAGLSGSLHAQDKVSRRQWQLQGKDIFVVEKYRHLVAGSTYETRRRRRARLWAKGSSMRTWVKNTKAWLLRRLGSSGQGSLKGLLVVPRHCNQQCNRISIING